MEALRVRTSAHDVPRAASANKGASWQDLQRMAFWPGMHKDFSIWINDCAVCHQFRTVEVMAPMRSTLASIDESTKLPWADVIVDCQGPFTRSAKGNCYTVSYHCLFLGVCKVEPFARLRKEEFLVALVTCVMRASRIPTICRTDRGPEMTNAVMTEFLTLCNARQYLGAAFTPRHQGPGERKHISVMQQWLILIHQVCKSFPQEWDTLAPVVEYLMDTEIVSAGFPRMNSRRVAPYCRSPISRWLHLWCRAGPRRRISRRSYSATSGSSQGS